MINWPTFIIIITVHKQTDDLQFITAQMNEVKLLSVIKLQFTVFISSVHRDINWRYIYPLAVEYQGVIGASNAGLNISMVIHPETRSSILCSNKIKCIQFYILILPEPLLILYIRDAAAATLPF